MTPLDLSYSGDTDILTIEGVRYAGEFFRSLNQMNDWSKPVRLKRVGDTLVVQWFGELALLDEAITKLEGYRSRVMDRHSPKGRGTVNAYTQAIQTLRQLKEGTS